MSQLLSEQASQQLVNSIVDIAEKIALEKLNNRVRDISYKKKSWKNTT